MVNLFYRWTFVFAFFFLANFVIAQSQVISNPVVSQPVKMGISQPMRDLPLIDSKTTPIWTDGIIPLREPFESSVEKVELDGSLKEFNGPLNSTSISANFDGVGSGGYAPPDPSGDVGPNHYVQMVNVQTQIWDKNGNSLVGPFDNSNFWSGLPGPWSSSNDGDPIVLYDEIADRWMVSQFALPNYPNGPWYILIAVSTTPDPTGTYYQYAYSYPDFPDYPKFGVWPDGYYMSANVFASGTLSFQGTYASVFDRNTMIAGGVATMQNFVNSSSTASLLPSDCDGAFPPVGAPNYFLATYSGNGSNTNLDIYEFHVDWATPSNSTFTGPLLLTTPAFSQPTAIPQLGTTNTLDNLASRPMNRLQYRNFGDHEAMVVCQTVNAGSGRAGMRWWELRKTVSNWAIYQEGTYAPADGIYRWMGSVAMDENGTIALGYSASSSSIYPDIRYTGRFESDPLGVMTIVETVIHAGGGSQTGTLSRWGDYTQMAIDPSESGTFWYTNEYIPTNGTFNWKTRIAAFSFEPPCPVGLASNPSPADGANDVPINAPEATWDNPGDATSNEFWFGTDPGSLTLLQSGTLATSFSIPSGTLDYSTTYYWRVDCANDTCGAEGLVWSFTTEEDPSLMVLFEDDFEAGSGNWTITNIGGTCDWDVWTSATWESFSLPTLPGGTAGQWLGANSDGCGSGTTVNSEIQMNASLDMSQYQKITLSYDSDFRVYQTDLATLDISTDGGSSWTNIRTLTGASVRNEQVVDQDISTFCALQSNVMFKMTYYGAYDYWWCLDNIVIKGSDIVPVELTSFTADVSGYSVNLNWNTATELNNNGFEVQRKTTAGQFEKIGYIEGSGTTTEPKTYTYTDNNVTTGSYTYRLKQIDFNGLYEYSDEINVEVDVPLTYNLEQNYPNPFNPSTLIKYSVANDEFVNVSVFNLLGQKVATLVNGNVKAGSYEVNFNASELSSGVYFYSIEAGNFKAIKKMMLMK